jgi:hypothetical protein
MVKPKDLLWPDDYPPTMPALRVSFTPKTATLTTTAILTITMARQRARTAMVIRHGDQASTAIRAVSARCMSAVDTIRTLDRTTT